MTAFLTSRLLSEQGVRHGFSLRAGGVSAPPYDALNLGRSVGDAPAAVDENLRRFADALGYAPAGLGLVSQVHGDRVVVAVDTGGGVELRDTLSGEALPKPVEADAIVAAPGTAVGVRTADCVPLLLFDPVSGAAAAVHAGWRGTVARIAVRAVEVLVREFGARPADLRAAIGPAIGRCCYEVGADLAERFASDPAFGPATVHPGANGPHLDLEEANARLLVAAGLAPQHVERLGACTACDPTRFFSHRRDRGRTGRHLAVVVAGRT